MSSDPSRNNARRVAFFRTVDRARAGGPICLIGVMPLAVRRVWG
jgi:hypothetical protein